MSLYRTALNDIPSKPLTDKCIVLDMDETLIHSCEDIGKLKELNILCDPAKLDLKKRTYVLSLDDVVYKNGTGIKTDIWGIVRPHVKEFLISCFAYFKTVIVWSAGKRKYVEAIVDHLFKDIRRPHVIYTRDDCEIGNGNLLVKPLQKMIDNENGLSKYMSLKNTFIVDDRLSVFEYDNPDNGIQIPAYKPDFNEHSLRTDNIALKQLMIWLNRPEVMDCKDVRELDKSEIFQKNSTNDTNMEMISALVEPIQA
jgi:TFIIF-interacting CTD phosphatase-like protein